MGPDIRAAAATAKPCGADEDDVSPEVDHLFLLDPDLVEKLGELVEEALQAIVASEDDRVEQPL